jgi:hypothetical protein
VQPILQEPLSAREIRQLDRFLLSDESPEETMDVSTLDGFLCAVLCPARI